MYIFSRFERVMTRKVAQSATKVLAMACWLNDRIQHTKAPLYTESEYFNYLCTYTL